MTSYLRKFLGVLCLAASALTLTATAPADQPGPKIQIGLVGTLFRDVQEVWVRMILQPFGDLMREQTGLDGNLVVVGDALELGQQLQEAKVQLAVFHGVEFAWAQQKYPDLRPLCIAINRHRDLFANLVVRDDSAAAGFADLKGKNLALPQHSREHCHLYLKRWCAEQGVELPSYFAKVVAHPGVEAALDDVVRGKVQGAVVDGVSLENYELVKPGCHGRLKVLQKSEKFPAAVVAYRLGTLDENTLAQFRNGMINAHRNVRSRIQMEMWSLTAFEVIPDDYGEVLQSILKAYPVPSSQTASAARAVRPAAP